MFVSLEVYESGIEDVSVWSLDVESSRVEGVRYEKRRGEGRGIVTQYTSPYLDVLKIKREIDLSPWFECIKN